MTLRQKLVRFLERYSPDQLLNTLQELLKNLIENIRNGGNITLAVLFIPFLLVAIGLLYPVVFLRRLLGNFALFLINLYKLIRKLFLIAIQESNAYWIRTREEGSELLIFLKFAIEKMLRFIEYLLDSIIKGSANFETDVSHSNSTLSQQIVLRLCIWSGFGLLAVVMSTILILTFLSGLPVLHRKLRGDFPTPERSARETPTFSITYRDIDW